MPNALCDLLAVLALAELGPQHEGVDSPSEIIELGNRWAGAGTPAVLESLSDPELRLTVLDKILDFADQLYAKAAEM